jgi:hypothetical protein
MADNECIDAAPRVQASPLATRIYVLKDPRDGSVRYVGKTVQLLKRRLKAHMFEALKKNAPWHSSRWIRQLSGQGLKPQIEEIELVVGAGWALRESGWIRAFILFGADLTNQTNGGDGIPGHVQSEEHRRRIGLANSGRSPSGATRDRLREVNLGKKHTPESRAKMGRTGIIKSPETCLRLRRAQLGKKRPPEAVEKMRLTKLGKKHTPEHCAKISAAGMGRKMSTEAVEKSAAARTGAKRTPEARALMRAGRLRYLAAQAAETLETQPLLI